MDIEQKAVDAEGDDAERSRLTQALVKVCGSASLATLLLEPASLPLLYSHLDSPQCCATLWAYLNGCMAGDGRLPMVERLGTVLIIAMVSNNLLLRLKAHS